MLTKEPMFQQVTPELVERLAKRLLAAAWSLAENMSFEAALFEVEERGWVSDEAHLWLVRMALSIAQRADIGRIDGTVH